MLFLQVFLLFFFLLMISNPSLTLSCATNALLIWYKTLVPTLLPVLILSSLIVETRAWELFIPIIHPIFGHIFHTSPCGSFSILLGILCGYPMGAKIVSDLYQNQDISFDEANYLLRFTSFPSPMFLNGYVLQQCFPNDSLQIPFLIAVYGSAFLIGIFTPHQKINLKNNNDNNNKETIIPPTLTFSSLQKILLSAFQIILFAGLYMMLATIFANFLGQFLTLLFWKDILQLLPLLIGTIEMTSGISLLFDSPLFPSALIAIFLCCFGGFAIALQTSSVLPNKSRPIKYNWLKHYLFWKLIHGIVAMLILSVILILTTYCQ